MEHVRQFYIGGQWVDPATSETLEVINPATEQPITSIAVGQDQDVDAAVAAARSAFDAFSQTSKAERLELLDRDHRRLQRAHRGAGRRHQPGDGRAAVAGQGGPGGRRPGAHLATARAVLADFEFERSMGSTLLVREAIGVCGMITPWNWPLNQIACKVAPALATGCTMVLKPSEVAPLNAILFAEILDEAGVPAGVFNLVNGYGTTVGAALSAHPDIDMMSFTGSTRAGIEVARAAAPTVKRVAQELGGKSANIILDDADLEAVITRDMGGMCTNSGQSCNAPTRMLVPAARMDEAAAIAAVAARAIVVGDPQEATSTIGPVVSATQYSRIQQLIEKGIGEGAKLEVGGPGKPDGLRDRLLRPADGVLARDQRHDDRPRGDLRAGSRDDRLRGRRRRRAHRQRHRRTACPATSLATATGPSRWPAGSGPATSTSTAPAPTSTLRSAATGSPATAGSGARSASRSTWRPRRSWATPEPARRAAEVELRVATLSTLTLLWQGRHGKRRCAD